MASMVLQSVRKTHGTTMVYCQQCRRYRGIRPDGTCGDCGCRIVQEKQNDKANEKLRK